MEYKLLSRLQTIEFMLTYLVHPVVKDFQSLCHIENKAIAQHYGFPTEYMDITNNKWVAAFFATTQFDDDTYKPVKTGFGKGYGVVYISKKDSNLLGSMNKLISLGFQYFARPSKQSSWVYKMEDGENFDALPEFDRIIFRHDTAASKLVYEYAYRQNRFFPKDLLSDIARTIRQPGYTLSRGALMGSKMLGMTQTENEQIEILNKFGFGYGGKESPIVKFNKKDMEKDWKQWIEYGKPHLLKHILPIVPVYDYPM